MGSQKRSSEGVLRRRVREGASVPFRRVQPFQGMCPSLFLQQFHRIVTKCHHCLEPPQSAALRASSTGGGERRGENSGQMHMVLRSWWPLKEMRPSDASAVPDAVIPSAVGCRMSANERKRKPAKGRNRARKRALPCKDCKQPGLKQPGVGTPKSPHQEKCRQKTGCRGKASAEAV